MRLLGQTSRFFPRPTIRSTDTAVDARREETLVHEPLVVFAHDFCRQDLTILDELGE